MIATGRLAAVLAVTCLLGGQEMALAWGPATHIGFARTILDQLGLLPVAVGAVLARNAAAYLYGNIAADVVFAKRWSRIKQCCHHWSTGFRLLHEAESDKTTAFAFGYLSHLAADTVAHGKYVPRQIVLSGCSMNFGHLYWELRADAMEGADSLSLLRRLVALDQGEYHLAMAPRLTGTFLPYPFNRALFGRMNALAVRPTLKRTVDAWSRCSRWDLPWEVLHGYRSEAVDRIQAILSDQHKSALLREDPNGTSALMQLRVQRRRLRRMARRGVPVAQCSREAARGLAPL